MCWAVPGRITAIKGNIAVIDISGVRKNAVLDLISNPREGEYVLLHAGYAIQKINEESARFTIDFFKGKQDNA